MEIKTTVKKIVFIHMFNNFSGSPNVLAGIVDNLTTKCYDTTIISSFNNSGFLSSASCNRRINISYDFKKSLILRLFQFVKFQLLAGVKIFQFSSDHIIYINTIQPFLPAIIASLRKMKIIYHVHEAYPKLSLFNKFLCFVLNKTATEIICVSDYVKKNSIFEKLNSVHVVHNSIWSADYNNVVPHKMTAATKSVLMISSARTYKGIIEFCELARIRKSCTFVLICDATISEIELIFKNYLSLSNLEIIPTQINLNTYYSKTDLLLNLSNPKLIVETFGLTVLEAMHYGIPAIVPPVGGITELIDDGYNGFHADVNDLQLVLEKIDLLLNDQVLYEKMSRNALAKVKEFNPDLQIKKIVNIIEKKH